MEHSTGRSRLRRLASLAAVAAGVGGTSACNDFLQAENPGAIPEESLTSPRYASLISNGVVGEFQPMLGFVGYWNAIFTDELTNRAAFFEEPLIDQRRVTPENGTYGFFIYGNLQRTRFLADDGARRLKLILGDSATRDIRLATTQAYGGMTYVYMGEMLCSTPIDRGVPKPPAEVFADAITRFEEAITVAAAAEAAARARRPVNAADTILADNLRNFALVGAARASLNRDDKPKAIEYARQVPAAFAFFSNYSKNTARETNWFWNRLTAGRVGTMADTPFAAMAGDPRVPRLGGTTVAALVPNSPLSFSTYNGTETGAPITEGSSIRIASGLEARYIVAEAQGPTAATLALVNERRAVGKQPAIAATGAELMAALRDQRRRDFYLDNHRLGDLRRYLQFYQVNEFPQGVYPGTTTNATYNAAQTCWPLPISEINDNPNAPRTP